MRNKSVKKIIISIIALIAIIISCIVIRSFADNYFYYLYREPNGSITINHILETYCLNRSHACRTASATRGADPLVLASTVKFYKTYIDIDGDHYKYNKEAAQMAWLSQQGPNTSTFDSPENDPEYHNVFFNHISEMQYATWRYATAFLNSSLSGVGTNTPLVMAKRYNISPADYSEGYVGSPAVTDAQIGAGNVNEINKWADLIMNDTVETTLNKADGFEVNQNFNIDGKECIKMGPFTMTFGGNALDLATYTKNGEKLTSAFYKYTGKQLKEVGFNDGELKSGGAFYIVLPKSDETNARILKQGIQKVVLTTEGGNPLPENDSQGAPPSIQWFRNVQSDASIHHQDQAIYFKGYWQPQPSEKSVDINTDIDNNNYSLIIEKYAADENNKPDINKGQLAGAWFSVKKEDTGKYISARNADSNRDGIYEVTEWTTEIKDARFSTGIVEDGVEGKGQPIKFENLEPGTYIVTEEEAPPGYKKSVNGEQNGVVGKAYITEDRTEPFILQFANPQEKVSLIIEKYAADENKQPDTSKGQLAGAWFSVKKEDTGKYISTKNDDPNGNGIYEATEWTTDVAEAKFQTGSTEDGVEGKGQPIKFENLEPGTYIVTEEEAPPGYQKSINGEQNGVVGKAYITEDMTEPFILHFANPKESGGDYELEISKYQEDIIYDEEGSIENWEHHTNTDKLEVLLEGAEYVVWYAGDAYESSDPNNVAYKYFESKNELDKLKKLGNTVISIDENGNAIYTNFKVTNYDPDKSTVPAPDDPTKEFIDGNESKKESFTPKGKKYDIETGEVYGDEYTISDEEGKSLPKITVSGTGITKIKGLYPGAYLYKEVKAPGRVTEGISKEGTKKELYRKIVNKDTGEEIVKDEETYNDFVVDEFRPYCSVVGPEELGGQGEIVREGFLDETAAGLHIKKYAYDQSIDYDTASDEEKRKNPIEGKQFTIQLKKGSILRGDERLISGSYEGGFLDPKGFTGNYKSAEGAMFEAHEKAKVYKTDVQTHEQAVNKGYVFTTGGSGDIYIRHLIPGTYIIREVKNEGMQRAEVYTKKKNLKNDETIIYDATPTGDQKDINVAKDNESGNGGIEVYVRKKEFYHPVVSVWDGDEEEKVRIKKVDKDSGNPIAGASFTIKNSDGNYLQADGSFAKESFEFTTNENGLIEQDVPAGEYVIQETRAPGTFELDPTEYTVRVPGGIKEIENKSEPVPEFGFRKVIKDATDVGLEGFEFKLEEHPIEEEYPEIPTFTGAGCSDFYYPTSEHCAFNRQEGVDNPIYRYDSEGHLIEAYCSRHHYGPEHAAAWMAARDVFNQMVDDANKYHGLREQAITELNAGPVTTNKDGYASIKPLSTLVDDNKGLIDIEETSVGGNPYFNMDSTRKEKIDYHGYTEMENERKRMDIEGYIWEDLGQTKANTWNSLFDGNEPLVQPIEVNFKCGNEKIADGVVTGDGRYRIRVGDKDGSKLKYLTDKSIAKNTYIEFTYNGVVFQCVEVNLGAENGSKAKEKDKDRKELINDPYTSIYANTGSSSKSEGSARRPSTDVNYWRNEPETQQNTSKTRYEGSVSGAITRTEAEAETTGDVNYVVSDIPKIQFDQQYEYPYDTGFTNNCYTITPPRDNGRSVEQTKYQISATTLEAEFKEFENYTVAQDRITNVNLGLRRREEPDLAVVNDIYQVRIEYDGHKQIEQYGKKMADNLSFGSSSFAEGNDTPYHTGGAFDVNVKFENDRKGYYFRELYPSDIEMIPTSQKDKNKNLDELNVYVTYKTSIYNESSNLTVRPTEIISQYDSRYIGYYNGDNYIDAPKDVTYKYQSEETNGVGVTWSRNGYGQVVQAAGGGEGRYQQAYGKIDKFIEPEQQIFIYTEYRLARQQCLDLLNGDPDSKIDVVNHIEINAYTTQINGENYGHIDKDSHPGNMRPEYVGNKNDTYEDDNDDAPILTLKKAKEGNRVLEGNVFEDLASSDTYTTQDGREVKERRADGEKQDTELPIQNVRVQLMEVDNINGIWTDSGRIAKLDINSNKDGNGNELAPSDTEDNKDTYITGGQSTNPKQVSEQGGEYYWDTLDRLRDADVMTSDTGTYRFVGYAPGRYLIKYTWGQGENTVIKNKIINNDGNTQDKLIETQQYKSTVFGKYSNENDVARVETGETTPGQERYKTYLEYQGNGKPQRWYLHATNPEAGELDANGNAKPDGFSHTNLSNAIDEISRTDKVNSTKPEDGELKENENGQRVLVDNRLKDVDNTNNYNNYMDSEYNAEWGKPATNRIDSTADGDLGYSNFEEYQNNEKLKEMYSRTVSFDIGVEYIWDNNDEESIDPTPKNGEGHSRKFEIHNLDFGITERPNINLQMKKEIENVKVYVDTTDEMLVNLDFKDGKISGPEAVKGAKYLKPEKSDSVDSVGVLHIEMDSELIHGSIVQITYKYTIKNTSELDYNLQIADYGEKTAKEGEVKNVYYKFGDYEPDEEEVTMTATKVVDYLDNKLQYDETLEDDPKLHPFGSDNQLWIRDEILTDRNSSGDVVPNSMEGLYDRNEVFSNNDFTENGTSKTDAQSGQEAAERIKKKYRTLTRGEHGNYDTDPHTYTSSERENDNGGPLRAENWYQFRLTASKGVGNDPNEDMSYFNTAEIIKIRKTGGEYPGELAPSPIENGPMVPVTTPGNNDPTDPRINDPVSSVTTLTTEPDSWTAEQVTITPPTGDVSQYVAVGWTVIAIVSLGILGSGTIAVRNAVKRKKNDN